MNTKKPWAVKLGRLRLSKPLYTRARWGLLAQNIPDMAEEFGLITPLVCVSYRGPAAKWFYLVLPLGIYREEITLL